MFAPICIATSGGVWLWPALGSHLSLVCLAVIVAMVAVLLVVANAAWQLGHGTPVLPTLLRRLARDERASTTLEFGLIFPFILFAGLALAQSTMLFGGNLFVHYAAFAATRSAIVQIPPAISQEEPADTIVDSPGMPKHEAIRLAAVVALVPASGQLAAGTPAADTFVAGLNAYYTSPAYGQTSPGWVNNLAAGAYRYADVNTTISVLSYSSINEPNSVTFTLLSDGGAYTFGPRDPITVRVSHKLYLGVPYANRLFADGVLTADEGSGRYAQVTAQSTLTNEGVTTDLPPDPASYGMPRMN